MLRRNFSSLLVSPAPFHTWLRSLPTVVIISNSSEKSAADLCSAKIWWKLAAAIQTATPFAPRPQSRLHMLLAQSTTRERGYSRATKTHEALKCCGQWVRSRKSNWETFQAEIASCASGILLPFFFLCVFSFVKQGVLGSFISSIWRLYNPAPARGNSQPQHPSWESCTHHLSAKFPEAMKLRWENKGETWCTRSCPLSRYGNGQSQSYPVVSSDWHGSSSVSTWSH